MLKHHFMKRIFSAIALFLCIAVGCKKDSSFNFSGYTPTDFSGNPMGAADQSDWTFDASWSQKEWDLFDFEAGDLTGTTAGTVTMYPGYPNPAVNSSNITFTSTTACKLRYTLVNEKGHKLWSYVADVEPGSNTLSLYIAMGYSNDLHRLYYVFDAQGSPAFLKGHGDIMVQD